MNRSGDVGTKTETATVKVLRRHGFPHAERRRPRGHHDPGDLTGTPGIAWSVKGGNAARDASDNKIEEWLDRAEDMRTNTASAVAVLVVARKGIGYDNACRWWAIVRYVAAYDLRFGDDRLAQPEGWDGADLAPVRFYLADLCLLLTEAGYGEPGGWKVEVAG